MIPNPFGKECRVIYIPRVEYPHVHVYGPGTMQCIYMKRRNAAVMVTRIQNRVKRGKGTIIPVVDGWEYRP